MNKKKEKTFQRFCKCGHNSHGQRTCWCGCHFSESPLIVQNIIKDKVKQARRKIAKKILIQFGSEFPKGTYKKVLKKKDFIFLIEKHRKFLKEAENE